MQIYIFILYIIQPVNTLYMQIYIVYILCSILYNIHNITYILHIT